MEEMPHFVELPTFERYRENYLSDDEYRGLQKLLIENPEAGKMIKGTGGLRKVRYSDRKRGKGTRGGIRVIYYYQLSETRFLMFTLYNKDEVTDLSENEKSVFRKVLQAELSRK